MKLKKLILILVLTLFYKSVLAQLPPVGQNVSFSSPQASAMGKYGGHPVNYSTGTPNINVPLLTLWEGSLKLPLLLQYTYSGFRPTDQASWTGLGFTMVTGVVTRTVKGFPDELSGQGYLTQPGNIASFVNENSFSVSSFTNNGIKNMDDTAPDNYAFEFNGYSGKFIIDNTGNGQVISDSPIKITYQKQPDPFSDNNSVIIKWIFTTEDGTVYTFENKEYTETNMEFSPDGPNAEYLPSAWYLSEVVDIKGNRITFEYTLPEKSITGTRLQYGRWEQYEIVELTTGGDGVKHRSSILENRSTEIYLTKIKGSGWELVFNSEQYNRLSDQMNILLYARKLNNIQLFNTNAALA